MTDPHSISYNIINKLGKYKENPLAESFKQRVEIRNTRLPWDDTREIAVFVLWKNEHDNTPVIMYPLEQVEDDDDY